MIEILKIFLRLCLERFAKCISKPRIQLFYLLSVIIFPISTFGQAREENPNDPITPMRYFKSLTPSKWNSSKREISFEVDQATDMDIDVSPDGKFLLFSFLGNIYSLPSDGGNARQLTKSVANYRSPIWSPNGKLIAYESDESGSIKIGICKVDGERIGSFGVPLYEERLKLIWHQDNSHFFANRDVYDLFGNHTTLPKDILSIIKVSNDLKSIFSLKPIDDQNSILIKASHNDYLRDSLTIIKTPFNEINNPKISPDEKYLTYMKFGWSGADAKPLDSLMIVDLTTGEQMLLANLNIRFTGFAGERHYSFTPDSKFLYIGYGGKIHRIEIKTCVNQIIPFSAKVHIELKKLNYNKFRVSLEPMKVRYVRSAQKSPNGKHLLFSALNKVYIMDLPNGIPRIFINQQSNQFQPTISPDGKWVLYTSWSDTEGGYVWKASILGGIPEKITVSAGLYQHPCWSPDGKYIAVVKGKNELKHMYPGNGELQLIQLNNKSVEVLANRVPLFNNLQFSQDGKSIVFKPDQVGGDDKAWPRLVSLDILSKEVINIANALKSNENYFPIRQILLSPNRKYLSFMYNEDLYLLKLDSLSPDKLFFNEFSREKVIRFARGSSDPQWEENGNKISWLDGCIYYSTNTETIFSTARSIAANIAVNGLPQTNVIDVNLKHVKKIEINIMAPRYYGKGIIALKNARIVTMNSSKVIENGTILIKNGRIEKVARGQDIKVPKNAVSIDLSGKTIMPGIIDVHSHMKSVAQDIFYQQSWQRLINFSYGITTARDPSGGFDTFGYAELAETGQMISPRLFTVGPAVRPQYVINNPNEAEIIVNNRRKYGATTIKQYLQKTRVQRQFLIDACKSFKLNMTNEIHKDPQYAIGMIKDGSTGIEHNPIWGDIYEDVISFLAKSQTFITPTLQVSYGVQEGKNYFRKKFGNDYINQRNFLLPEFNKNYIKDEIVKGELDSSFLLQSQVDSRIKKAGGKIVMGSHGEDQGIGAHWEMWALKMGGLTNYEALETATITAAEALGMQADLGSIEVGKIADLLILNANPLEDIHNSVSIKYVMKAGVLYESDTLKKIWPENKMRYNGRVTD